MAGRRAGLAWQEAGPYPGFLLPALDDPELHTRGGELFVSGFQGADHRLAVYCVRGLPARLHSLRFELLAPAGDPPLGTCPVCRVLVGTQLWVVQAPPGDLLRVYLGQLTSSVDEAAPSSSAAAPPGVRWTTPPLAGRSPSPALRSPKAMKGAAWRGRVVVWTGDAMLCVCPTGLTCRLLPCAPVCGGGPSAGLLGCTPELLYVWSQHTLYEVLLGDEGQDCSSNTAQLCPLDLAGPVPDMKMCNLLPFGSLLFVFVGGAMYEVDLAERVCTQLRGQWRGCKDVANSEFQSLVACGGLGVAVHWSSQYAEHALLATPLPRVPWAPAAHPACPATFRRVARALCLATARAGAARLPPELVLAVLRFAPWTLFDWPGDTSGSALCPCEQCLCPLTYGSHTRGGPPEAPQKLKGSPPGALYLTNGPYAH
eukprot:EG_transcript_12168